MSLHIENYALVFPADYDAQSEHETPSRGYLSDVVVRLDNGATYRLFFVDPFRLRQELEDNGKLGKSYFAEPNLIVLPEVTTASIRKAVEGLVSDSLLRQLKPE